jgi:hypothetical protein
LQGTGTRIIEAKLVQQLAHLEQTPFFGGFIAWGRQLMPWIGATASILALLEAGPQMLRLVHNFWGTARMAGISRPVAV